jgi:hypothetical protein
MARTALDALLGRLLFDGVEAELLGGLNFEGFTVTEADGYYTVVPPGVGAGTIPLAYLAEAVAQYDFVMRTSSGAGAWERGTRASLVLAIDGQTVATFLGAPRIQLGGASTTRGLLNASIGGFGADGGLILAARTNGGTECNLLRWDSTDKFFLGSTSAAQVIASVATGGYFAVRVNNVEVASISTTGLGTFVGVNAGGAVTGVTALTANSATIGGAIVAAPVQGTAVTTTATITVAGGNNYVVSSAGGAYTLTIGTGGTPYIGEVITLICAAALANAITVLNGGAGGTNIGPGAGADSGKIPAGTKLVCDFRFDGTNWALAGVKRLA